MRNRSKLDIQHKNLTIIEGDATTSEAVSETLDGVEAVLSAIGVSGMGKTTVYSDTMRVIVAAMKRQNLRRIVCIGAVGMEPELNRNIPFIGRIIIRLVLKNVLVDMLEMQRILEAADLDWTVMWPPRLGDGEKTGVYRIAFDEALKKGSVISRADLAHCMVANIGNSGHFKRRVAIAY